MDSKQTSGQNLVQKLPFHFLLESDLYGFSFSEQEELREQYASEMREAENLGSRGWVVSQEMSHVNINKYIKDIDTKGEQILEPLLISGQDGLKKYFEFFDKIYSNTTLRAYFDELVHAIERDDNMTAAIYASIIFERRLKVLTEKRRYRSIASAGIDQIGSSAFSTSMATMNMPRAMIDEVYVFPSLKAFCERFLVDGDWSFDTSEPATDPPYLNRNWLVHGVMIRPVERYMVVQVLNALQMMELIIEESSQKPSQCIEEH